MNCQGCGKAFESSNASFCTGCGKKVETPQFSPQPQHQLQPQPYIPPPIQNAGSSGSALSFAPWVVRGAVAVLIVMFFVAPLVTIFGQSGGTLFQVLRIAIDWLNWFGFVEEVAGAIIFIGLYALCLLIMLLLASKNVAAAIFAIIGAALMGLLVAVSEGLASGFLWLKVFICVAIAVFSFATIRKKR
ncbi:MAG: hypothetical protein FWE44_04925 [Defluviitaleaceae bacterium]|nr:hypothetical protein [Defluviitaleaceae bacterium]